LILWKINLYNKGQKSSTKAPNSQLIAIKIIINIQINSIRIAFRTSPLTLIIIHNLISPLMDINMDSIGLSNNIHILHIIEEKYVEHILINIILFKIIKYIFIDYENCNS